MLAGAARWHCAWWGLRSLRDQLNGQGGKGSLELRAFSRLEFSVGRVYLGFRCETTFQNRSAPACKGFLGRAHDARVGGYCEKAPLADLDEARRFAKRMVPPGNGA